MGRDDSNVAPPGFAVRRLAKQAFDNGTVGIYVALVTVASLCTIEL